MNSQEASLLHLFTLWRNGARILAGTGVPPEHPVPTGPRVWKNCEEPNCHTTMFGATDVELADRWASHRRQCHV